MSEYKVAIITRTKNRNLLLRRAIKSVLSQTFNDWIMVIVNDGGNRQQVDELVEEYKTSANGRIRVIHNEQSMGMEAASNIGIKAVNSKYIVIHDDDDSWHPQFLEKCVSFLENNPDAKGVITHSIRVVESIESEKIIVRYQEPFNSWLNSITIFRMAAGNVFPPISFVYKREVFQEIGYYREDLPVLGDWEFNLRFIEKYDIFVIQEPLAFYHHRIDLKDGEYSNSVIGGINKHLFYDTLLRNELLRRDLSNNRLGIGYLVNLSKSFEIVHGQIGTLEKIVNRVKQIKWINYLAKRLLK